MLRSMLMILTIIASTACVRTTSHMLNENTAMISARGTAFDTPASVFKQTLKQAALLTQERGYEYFQIVSATDATRRGYYTAPQTASTTGSATFFGSRLNYNQSTNYSAVSGTELIKPGTDLAIIMLRKDEIAPNQKGVWNAVQVLAVQ